MLNDKDANPTPRLASLAGLRAFEAVARTGSVRSAAAELFVTPGAVSQQVKALEAELGVQLLRRRGTGIAITESGLEVRDDLTAAFRQLQRITARLKRGPRSGALRLRIDDPALAANWLLARMQHYRALPGSIDVVLETATSGSAADPESFDIAVRYGLDDFPGFNSHRLFADEVYPVCSPDLVREHRLQQPADLSRVMLLHLAWNAEKLPWPDWRAWLRAAGVDSVDTARGIRFTDFSLCLQAAVAGQGVALGTTAVVADLIAAGRLVAPFEKSIVTPFGYYLVYTPAMLERPEARGFIEWILLEASQTET
jgi:LysR family glycine cleavage system transcriptional activator